MDKSRRKRINIVPQNLNAQMVPVVEKDDNRDTESECGIGTEDSDEESEPCCGKDAQMREM